MTKNEIINCRLCKGQIALFYLGQEGFLIKYNDKYLLIDGYLSDYVDRHCCSENVKWHRRYPAPISPFELDFVDYVFCTHAHFDHADPDTLGALAKINGHAKYIVPLPIVNTVSSYGIKRESIIGAKAGKEILFDDITVKPIAAAHEQINLDENGDCFELGFKITLGDTSIYHAGDCCIYDKIDENIGHCDIALLPVNGRDYYRLNECDIVGNMDSREAVTLAEKVGAKMIVPMHFDLYDCNSISAMQFTEYAMSSSVCFHIFKPGEKYIYS